MPQSNFGSVALRTPHIADFVDVPAVAALPTIDVGSGGGQSNAAFRPSLRHGIVAGDLGGSGIGSTTDNYCVAYLHQDVNYYADARKHRSAEKNRPLEDLVDGGRYLSINADCVVKRQRPAQNKGRTCKSCPSHSRSKSPTVHLGFFEGERKQASRGWDEDTSTAARNILAMLAVACFLMAVSLLVDAIDAPPPVTFITGETAR